MFVLVLLEDIVRIPPEEFDREGEAIHYQVNQKFANKVIEDVGLCIEVYDILSISQGTVYSGDGAAFATVKFRMIVFKPFVGELLVGTIKSMDKNGVILSFDFFDQAIIPPGQLQEGSEWSEKDKAWYWPFGGHKLWMSVNEQVRVRIDKVVFNPPESKRIAMQERKALLSDVKENVPAVEEKKPEPAKPAATMDADDDDFDMATENTYIPVEPKALFRSRPMYLIVTSCESGLGLTSWWLSDAATQGEGAEGEYGEEDYGDYAENEGEEAEAAEGEEDGLVHAAPEKEETANADDE